MDILKDKFIKIVDLCKNIKLEKLFLCLMIPIGLLYLILMLPLHVPDEIAHIRRAYNIANFQIIEQKNEAGEAITKVPQELIENWWDTITSYEKMGELLGQKTDYENEKHEFNPAQGYSPMAYIFSALAISFCKLVGLNIWIAIYLARILNFVAFLVLGYYALKIMPIGKLILFVYMFNPLFIQQAASVSCDSLINSFTIAYIAFTTYLIVEKNKLSNKDKIIYAILAIFLSIAKYVYLPIIFINIALIFKKDFNKKDKIYIVLISLICIITALIWYKIGTGYVDTSEIAVIHNSNSQEQVKYLINNPQKIPELLANTLDTYFTRWVKEFLGGSLGYLKIHPSQWLCICYGVLLILSVFLEKDTKQLGLFSKLLNIVIAIGISFLVLIGLYMTWSAVGSNIITGVQGRYFIPVIILVLLALKSNKISYNLKANGIIFAILLTVINIGVIREVVNYF